MPPSDITESKSELYKIRGVSVRNVAIGKFNTAKRLARERLVRRQTPDEIPYWRNAPNGS